MSASAQSGVLVTDLLTYMPGLPQKLVCLGLPKNRTSAITQGRHPLPFDSLQPLRRPLWGISGHSDKSAPCPLYSQQIVSVPRGRWSGIGPSGLCSGVWRTRRKGPMTKTEIDKFEAAQRQLDCGIRLWFVDEESLAIHTLAYAACCVLRDLFGSQKREVLSKFEGLQKFGEVPNFLKHADRDPRSIAHSSQSISRWPSRSGCGGHG